MVSKGEPLSTEKRNNNASTKMNEWMKGPKNLLRGPSLPYISRTHHHMSHPKSVVNPAYP